MLRTLALALCAALSICTLALAQEPPKPGPEHAKLKEMEGTWDCVMQFGDQKSKATATYKSICGGLWMTSDFQGDFGGQKFEGHGLDGYDLRKKKYVGVWVDSMETTPMHFSGEIDPKTKVLVMTGEHVGPDGKPQKFKNTTEHQDKDHFTFKMYMVDAEGKETLAFTIDYARRK